MPGSEMKPRGSLTFHDLGPLVVARGGEPLPVRGRRLTAALGLLLVNANHRVSTDALVDAVWGEEVSGNAASTLESHLWRLRRILEPDRKRGEPFTIIVHDHGGYRLAVAPDSVDSLRLKVMVGETRDLLVSDQGSRALARAEESLSLWRGEPWTPHTDEEWALASANRLREVASQLRELRIQALLASGDAATALSDLEPLLDADPLREHLWAMAMVAAYRLGRVQQALDTYGRARDVLLEQAGIEPGAELRDLQSQILQRDVVLDGQTRSTQGDVPLAAAEIHLPAGRAELFGRDTELLDLVDLVPRERLVSIVGAAGCGKTALAVETARRVAGRFPDGVWFIDLTSAADRDQLLDLVTTGLGLAAVEGGDVLAALRSFTRARRMLLVLDNCEHVLDETADLVGACLDGGSELVVLATSREPLALDTECRRDLLPLALPGEEADERALRSSPAVSLFLERFESAVAGPVTGRHDLALIAEICERVDGLPLAIELAAGQGRTFALEEIAERVRHDPAGLARIGRRGSRRHHETLHAAIELSVATLSAGEVATHQAVSVVPGPFTLELAARLADAPTWETASRLGNLAHRSMLTALGPRVPGAPSRFSQLATLRAHGLTTAAERDREAASRRRDDWVLELMAGAPPVGRPESLGWFARIDDNLAAVRATMQHTLVDEPSPIGPFAAVRIGMYCYYRGFVVEWERWTRLGSQVSTGNDFERLLLRCSHASAAGLVGRDQEFAAWFDELDAFRAMTPEEQVEMGEYLLPVMLTLWTTGEFQTGHRALAAMSTIAEQTGDPTVALFTEVARLTLASQVEAPETVLPAVSAAYERCLEAQNDLGGWVAASAGTISAIVGRRPDVGLGWVDRLQHHFEGLGGGVNGIGIELRGTLLAQAGQPYEALRALARSRALALRQGRIWPTMPSTPELLTALENSLSGADVDRAYREGSLRSSSAEDSSSAGDVVAAAS